MFVISTLSVLQGICSFYQLQFTAFYDIDFHAAIIQQNPARAVVLTHSCADWLRSTVGGMAVFGRRTHHVLRSACS